MRRPLTAIALIPHALARCAGQRHGSCYAFVGAGGRVEMLGISCGTKVIGVALVAFSVTGCAPLVCALCATFASAPAGTQADSDTISAELTSKCHDAVLRAAEPYGLVRAAFSRLGAIRASDEGAIAPILVTAVYLRRSGEETRRALIECRLDDAGNVIALIAPGAQGAVELPPSERAPGRTAATRR
jgi:hypothetical protein